LGRYEEAIERLKVHFDTVDELEINDFNISSTIRQLKLYSEFCSDSELMVIINLLEKYIK